MPRRPKRPTRSAAASDADAKKQKPRVHVSRHAIVIPPNTEPESPILSAGPASQRAARRADENATSEVTYGEDDYDKFTGPFGTAVASAYAKWRRPVTLNEVITEIAETGCKVKIGKRSKERFAWDGFKESRWQISRVQFAGRDPVTYPKDTAMPSRARDWRFSPSPAARRPLAKLSCEPSPRSSAGCVVC